MVMDMRRSGVEDGRSLRWDVMRWDVMRWDEMG
jgi:hypothetical protein